MFLLTAATTGQQQVQKESLVKQYDRALLITYRVQSKLHPKKTCRAAEKAIVFYRGRVWEYQDLLGDWRSPTHNPEKKKGACTYKLWVAHNWQAISREYRREYELVQQDTKKWHEVIIRKVFPNATEHRALGVAECESHLDTYAKNRTSGTSGLFQIHPGNRGRIIYWKGHGSISIRGNLFDPWNNARIALYMSKGGYDWHEWAHVCQR